VLTRWWIVARCHARPCDFTSPAVSSPNTVQAANDPWCDYLRYVLHGLDVALIALPCLVGGRQSVLILWTWLGLSPADDQSIVVELVFVIIGVELLKVELVA